MKMYQVPPAMLDTMRIENIGYMPFNQFSDIVKKFRDERFAAGNIDNFKNDIGHKYNLWTKSSRSDFHRNFIHENVTSPVWVSFRIPHIDKQSTFPICISIFDKDGIYFTDEQEICVQKIIEKCTYTTSWKRISTIKDFVLRELQSECQNGVA